MASPATSTMDSSFGDYGSYPEMGELLSQLNWQPDAGCVTAVAGICPADVHSFAPGDHVDSPSVAESGLLKSLDWNVDDATFSDVAVGFNGSECELDFDLFFSNKVTPQALEVLPAVADGTWSMSTLECSSLDDLLNPLNDFCSQGSTDSVIGSVEAGHSSCQFTPQALETPPAAGAVVPGHTTLWMSSCFDVSSPDVSFNQPRKDFCLHGSPDSGIGSVEAVPSPSSEASFEASATSGPEQFPAVTIPDLESLLQSEPAPREHVTESLVSAGTLLTFESDESLCPKSPSLPTSKSSKSLKSRTTEEKKVRKRAQNRNAATRYREKKRDEARGIYENQTAEEEKNKSLRDNVALISREIQCMKELLREVYRSKGIIE